MQRTRAKKIEARTEASPPYAVTHAERLAEVQDAEDDMVIAHALRILASRLKQPGMAMLSPETVRKFVALEYGALPHEEFGAMLLNAQHCVLHHERLFRGTLAQTSVYPREVVKLVLHHNAAAVIFVHNHPSGSPEPSRADEFLTTTLKSALALVDVRVLDHIVVGGTQMVSFVERGLL